MFRTLRAWVVPMVILAMQAPDASPAPRAFAGVPRLVLWAWERPADLRGLGDDVGVAFLALSIDVTERGVGMRPRRQPLRVSGETPLVAVTRIDAAVRPSGGILDAMAGAIAGTARLPRVRAIQVDFDAAASQRSAYRDLLHRVRAAIGPDLPLSMTALASWCAGDPWLDGLPVDEAVPMLFEMGAPEPRLRLGVDHVVRATACRGAVGISLGEPIRLPRDGRRVYVFNHAPWSASSIRTARESVQ
jgi:hypothetical protein